MTGFVIAVTIGAWASLWLKPGQTVRMLLALLFVLLGLVFAYMGFKAWTSGTNPQAVVWLGCGVLTLLSRAGMAIRALFGEED